MSNDEQLADKLAGLLHTALRAHQSSADNDDVANTHYFKRLAGPSFCHPFTHQIYLCLMDQFSFWRPHRSLFDLNAAAAAAACVIRRR